MLVGLFLCALLDFLLNDSKLRMGAYQSAKFGVLIASIAFRTVKDGFCGDNLFVGEVNSETSGISAVIDSVLPFCAPGAWR